MSPAIQKVSIEATIDFEQLREQKRVLLELADRHEILEGLISLIDHIQDSFYAQLLENRGKEDADVYADRHIYLQEDL